MGATGRSSDRRRTPRFLRRQRVGARRGRRARSRLESRRRRVAAPRSRLSGTMTAMATGVLSPARTRPRLGWQRRLRRKLLVMDAVAGLSGALGTVLVRYDGDAAPLMGIDYRLLAVGTGLLWVVLVAA